MRFAAFTTVAASAGAATSSADMLDNLRQQTILAEELGYEAMWLGEQHFGPYGVGDLLNPILLGADLAARTSRIRIGQMANIAPWWHPIRLAEDLSILDNMTRGRIEVGFGRGIWPYEGPQFHLNADPRKDEKNRELSRETVEIVRKIWSDPYFSHEGPNYRFPAEGTVFSHPSIPPDPACILLVGSPDNVAEKVQELQEVCNLDYLLVEFTHPGIPLQRTLKNLENFATKVMPRFTAG